MSYGAVMMGEVSPSMIRAFGVVRVSCSSFHNVVMRLMSTEVSAHCDHTLCPLSLLSWVQKKLRNEWCTA